jgi:TRAP-type mannitol/chloroaromatic compound transport system permease small subunit
VSGAAHGREAGVWLRAARGIDALNELAGRVALWLVLAATLVSAANAISRYALGVSSNAWLEIQWYLFSAIVLLASGHALRHGAHVRVDAFFGRLSRNGQALVDLFGTLFFLLPFCALMAWLAWPLFVQSWLSGEVSPDAGGLIRWPVRLLMPLGFVLLALQGVSEIVKSLARLRGRAE